MTKTLLTTLTIGLLAQPLMATYETNPDCYKVVDTEVNVKKFSKVWENLHRNSSESQEHLQKYLEESLDANSGTLDVQKFSSVWQNLNHGGHDGQAHLKTAMNTMLSKASSVEVCPPATLICTSTIDVTKFSTLWNQVKVNGNNSEHLTDALDSVMSTKVCTI
jgi:hypothetical protein